ncbi:L,D-transpeptidase [Dictyobacter arantiisoli]|uniref:L,D-TPase catalytic domain-containing protein n=1 Tax=Dictyobacter arantiisoli TaxID=2014874 RepID=A0A5A5TEK2_9CHLR|nr:L,D-transpeptidase [Dictyobacter arantiisoli]GCF09439.1 hypothetical protein KDI_30030 [Dictyobacter arantiisoli]
MTKGYVVRIGWWSVLFIILLISWIWSPECTLAAHIADNSLEGSAQKKLIDVNLTQQKLTAFTDDQVAYTAYVMTGRPGLGTPTGTYHVFARESPTTFYSPWAPGTANWYPPTHINYALEWKVGGYYLHDSWWHSQYGPGTTGWHYDPMFGWQEGSHGCIAMALADARWLYQWAPIGTTVEIHY